MMKRKQSFLIPLLMAIVMMAMSPTRMWGQCKVLVGGTESEIASREESRSMPFGLFNYVTTISAYSPEEIGNSATFTSLSYYVQETGPISYQNVKIYMAMIDKDTEFSTTSCPSYKDFTLVYSGTDVVFSSTGWSSFVFNTPFEYSSDKQLVIACTHKGITNGEYPYFSIMTGKTVGDYNHYDETGGDLEKANISDFSDTKPCIKLVKQSNEHKWDQQVPAADATCTKHGNIAYCHCSECDSYFDTNGAEIAENGWVTTQSHTKDQEFDAIEATCTTGGNIAYYHCSVCNKYYNSSDEEIAENSWVINPSHTKDLEVDGVEATCTTGGNIAYYHCSACNKYFNSSDEEIAENSWVVAQLGHDVTQKAATAATCTERGNKEYWYCSRCKTYFKEKACETAYTDDMNEETGVWIALIDHVMSESYDSEGLKHCATCSKTLGEAPALVSDESDPFYGYYAISKPGHLVWFRDKVSEAVYDAENDTYTYPYAGINGYLVNDINMSSVCHAADPGTEVDMLSWEPIGSRTNYLGTFDGNSKSITGLYVEGQPRNALFAFIGGGSKVQNLTVEGNVTGNYAAIIVSMSAGNAEITRCVSKGAVNGTSANCAGVLGVDTSGNEASVTYCTNYATVTSKNDHVGGVVGNRPLKVEHCVNYGAVSGGSFTGGVVGYMAYPTNPVADCTNYGEVKCVDPDSYTYSNVGGVAGSGHGFTRCSNYADVTATSAGNVGGVSGYISGGYSYGFKDCLNTGDVKGFNNVGGLVGNLSSNNNTNSYTTGNVESTSPYAGLLVGVYLHNPSNALSNVYHIKGATVKANGTEIANQIQGSGSSTIQTPATPVESAEVSSGKLAWRLESNAETPGTWGQDLTSSSSPQLGGPKVYFSGAYQCNGIMMTEGYTNDASLVSAIPAHSAEYESDGFCTACGESKTLHGTGTAEDPYLISSVAQLEWFRDQANAASSDYTACAKLVNDIDLSVSSNSTWTPIKISSNYAGTFDGNGHTVKNMLVTFYQGGAAGFFGWLANGSVVKNLTVEGECKSSIPYLGMIAGYSNGATITNCTAKGSIINTYNGSGTATGGILGYSSFYGIVRNIEGCVNYAEVSSTSDNVGGILGYMNNPVIITKCANYGSISGNNYNVGGILGYGCNNNFSFTISDCANYGDVTTKASNVAGLVGYVNPVQGTVIKDCYVGPCSVRGNANTYVTTYEPSGSLTSFSNIVYSQDCKVYTSYTATSPAPLSNYVAYGSYNTSEAFVGVSAAQAAAGEATFLLNGSANGGATWTQDLSDSESQPTLLGDADKYGVYLMGYAHGAAARSFSNDANAKNSLHADADDNGSHDTNLGYTSNGDETHDALCSVCGYAEHDEACNIVDNVCTKCLYEKLRSLQIADGEVYTRTTSATAESLSYTRKFANNDFSCLYVPFEAPVSGFTDCSIYAINMFQQSDTDDDGVVDDVTLEVIKAPEGAAIMANHPYLIKYNGNATGAEQTFTFENAPLSAALTPEYTCSSMNTDFAFKGTYTDVTPSADEYYTLVEDDGKVVLGTSANSIGSQRWYMTMTSRDSQFGNASGSIKTKSIRIVVAGEDDVVTGIVNTGTNFGDSLNGKFVENGKIVIIRNGHKYNLNGQIIK